MREVDERVWGTSGGRARFKTGFGGFCYLELAGRGRWRALIVVEHLEGTPGPPWGIGKERPVTGCWRLWGNAQLSQLLLLCRCAKKSDCDRLFLVRPHCQSFVRLATTPRRHLKHLYALASANARQTATMDRTRPAPVNSF